MVYTSSGIAGDYILCKSNYNTLNAQCAHARACAHTHKHTHTYASIKSRTWVIQIYVYFYSNYSLLPISWLQTSQILRKEHWTVLNTILSLALKQLYYFVKGKKKLLWDLISLICEMIKIIPAVLTPERHCKFQVN